MIDIGKRLRAARENQNLSLRDLAARVDVSASLLSQIENGRSNPSVNTLYRIAVELSLPMDYFFVVNQAAAEESASDRTASEARVEHVAQSNVFDDGEETVAAPVLRAPGRPAIELNGGVTWTRLTADAEQAIEFLEITYAAGAQSGERMSRHAGREFGLIVEGTLTLELSFERYEMGPGDSIIFDSETPHRLSNNGDTPVRAFWVVFDSV